MKIPNLTCFDVGARNGLSDLKQLAKQISLFSFEPSIHEQDLLNKNTRQDYLDFHLISKGLYHSAGVYNLNIMANPSMSSLLEPNESILKEYFDGIKDFKKWRNQLTIVAQKQIETTTIDAFVEEQQITSIDYLKIDTQGTELDILKGAVNSLKDGKISIIKTEFAFVPFYKNQATFTEIDIFLKSMDYKLVTCEFQYGTVSPFLKNSEKPKWGLAGDAFYCLDFANSGDREKMLRAAVVLCGLGFRSNAEHLFNILDIPSSHRDDIYKKTLFNERKVFLKYLLPPVLIHQFKNLFKIASY